MLKSFGISCANNAFFSWLRTLDWYNSLIYRFVVNLSNSYFICIPFFFCSFSSVFRVSTPHSDSLQASDTSRRVTLWHVRPISDGNVGCKQIKIADGQFLAPHHPHTPILDSWQQQCHTQTFLATAFCCKLCTFLWVLPSVRPTAWLTAVFKWGNRDMLAFLLPICNSWRCHVSHHVCLCVCIALCATLPIVAQTNPHTGRQAGHIC